MSLKIILQDLPSLETRAVRTAAMMMDSGAVFVRNASIDALPMLEADLDAGALPVGSVEFVRRAMSVAGIREPDLLGYPDWALPWINPAPKLVTAREVVRRCFVKPRAVKLFTGFVYDPQAPEASLSESDAESLSEFRRLSPDEPVYVRPVVSFESEWRAYVDAALLAGLARYDQNEAEAVPSPDQSVIDAVLAAGPKDHPYAADFGVLDTGQTVVVEINDFWAIGLYQRALEPRRYLDMLSSRWTSIRAQSTV